jgi:hypothetical protein
LFELFLFLILLGCFIFPFCCSFSWASQHHSWVILVLFLLWQKLSAIHVDIDRLAYNHHCWSNCSLVLVFFLL